MGDDEEEYEKLVRILEPFRNVRIPTGPVILPERYLRMIDEAESAPENRSGADKTWVETAQKEFHEYFARVMREN